MNFQRPRFRVPELWGVTPGQSEAPELWRDARAVYGLARSGRTAHDLSPFRNRMVIVGGTALDVRATEWGQAWQFSQASNGPFLQTADNSSLDITGELTLAVVAIKDGAGSVSGNAGLIAKSVGSGSNNRSFLLASQDTTPAPQQLTFNCNPSGTSVASVGLLSASTAITYGKPFVVVATFRPSALMRLNVDGNVTELASGVPASLFSGTAPLWIGRQFGSLTTQEEFTWNGAVFFAGVFARAWTEMEEQEFLADPFAMVRMRRMPRRARPPSTGGLVGTLDGSLAASATIAADMAVSRALSGSIAGQAAVQSEIHVARSIAGSVGGGSAVAGQMAVTRVLAGAVSGSVAIAAGLAVVRQLAGSIPVAAGIGGELYVVRVLEGGVTATAVVAAAMGVPGAAIVGNVAAGSAVAALMSVVRRIEGDVTASAVPAAGLVVVRLLSGQVGASALVAALMTLGIDVLSDVYVVPAQRTRFVAPASLQRLTVPAQRLRLIVPALRRRP